MLRPHAAVFTAINHFHRGKWCLFPVEIKQIMHRKLANENNDAREKEMREGVCVCAALSAAHIHVRT